QNLIPQLDLLFQQIDRVAEPLTDELYSRLKALEDQFSVTSSELTKSQNKLAEAFESRIKPTLSKKFDGLSQVAKKDAVQASKRRFFEEWNDTLQLLRKISDQVVQDQNRPAWVNADVP